MANGAPDPIEFARKLSESFREVKFGQGIVGKTAYATVAVIGLWALILFRLSGDWWLNVALFVGAAAGTCVYFWWVTRTQEFAEKNPSLALLEGAQLLEWQRWDAEVKGKLLLKGPQIPDPHALLPQGGNNEQSDGR